MGDADDPGGGASVLEREPFADVERDALAPAREGGRREQGVEGGGEAPALLERQKVVHVERADAFDRRLQHFGEQAAELGGVARLQAPLGQHREQHVLAALGGIGIFADQRPRVPEARALRSRSPRADRTICSSSPPCR